MHNDPDLPLSICRGKNGVIPGLPVGLRDFLFRETTKAGPGPRNMG